MNEDAGIRLGTMNSFVLLTGATGVVGRLVLADLLRSQIPVAVLVRRSADQSAVERVERLLADLDKKSGRTFVRPVVLEGSLNEPGLGLTDEQQDWVRTHCGRVIHSAASLSFRSASQHPHNEPFRTNVDGTRNLLEFCEQVDIREFHYVSTAYVCGLRSGRVAEDECQVGQEFANDYERSKAQSEEYLREHRALDSLTIYRPSIVVDTSGGTDGSTDQAIGMAYSTYELLTSRVGLPQDGEWLGTLGLSGSERKNLVTADWVARTIVQILRRPELHGTTYHLTSETGTSLAELEAGFRQAVRAANPGRQTSVSNCVSRAGSARAGLVDKLAEAWVATFLPYFRDDPTFSRDSLTHALQRCGDPPCPEIESKQIADLVGRADDLSADRTECSGSDVALPEHRPLFESICHWSEDTSSFTCNNDVGILLTGAGGGSWTLCVTDDRLLVIPGQSETVTRRIYSSATVFQELLDGHQSVESAIATGRLIVEEDESGPSDDWARKLLSLVAERVSTESLC